MFTLRPASPPGTDWMLQSDPPPLPFDPFPELLVYPLGDNLFLVDDRSADYSGLGARQAAEAEALRALEGALGLASAAGGEGGSPAGAGWGGSTNDLWLQITAWSNSTAYLTIHAPWNDTNVSHELTLPTILAAWRAYPPPKPSYPAVGELAGGAGVD